MSGELDLIIAGVLEKWCIDLENMIKAKWDNSHGASWQKEIHHEIKPLPNLIMAEIMASGIGAFIAEFGSGSEMENEQMNPYLAEYKANSGMWNPAREARDNTFLGREPGATVHSPDGSTHTSSGRAKGLNLEWDFGKDGPYVPTPPMHIIKQEVEANKGLIFADLNAAVAEYVNAQVMVAFKIYT